MTNLPDTVLDNDLLPSGPCFIVDGEPFDPTQCGYTRVHNYVHYFWRPYLGNAAFALWELLLSFCYGHSDTASPSVTRLARMITNREHCRSLVIGRKDQASHSGGRREGALDILVRERLVHVIRRGQGQWGTHLFRVCKEPPLLRPDQVARLCPGLQREHERWLARRGIDRQTYYRAFGATPPTDPTEPRQIAATEDPGGAEPVPPTHPPTDDPTYTTTTPVRAAPKPAQPTTLPPSLPEHNPPPVALGNTPVAPDTQPVALDTKPIAPETHPVAPNNRPVVVVHTNNTEEQDLLKQWWEGVLNELRSQLTRSAFQSCLRRSRAQSYQNGVLTVQAPSRLALDLLEHRLAPLVQREAAATSQGRVREVRFVWSERCER